MKLVVDSPQTIPVPQARKIGPAQTSEFHYAKGIRVVGGFWRPSCGCGWTAAPKHTRDDAHALAVRHVASKTKSPCGDCQDVPAGHLWDGLILCSSCHARRVSMDLLALSQELVG